MNEDRIKELFSNEEFVKDLFGSKSYEEAQAKLAAKDLVVSVEELKKCRELLIKKQAGELSDDELEEVSGGLGFFALSWITIGLSIPVITGCAIATC